MYKVSLKLTDGDVIKGFAKDKTRNKDGSYTFKHSEGGTATFPDEDIQSITLGTTKVSVELELPKVEVITFPKVKGKTVLKSTKAPSGKLQQVIEIVSANMELTRQEMIALIVQNTGMGEAGASTYRNNALKALK